jgi:hypothetical protein
MIDMLAEMIPDYPGRAGHTRCFLHILNLIVKTVIHQFDAPKKKADSSMLDDAALLLAELSEGLELEEFETRLRDPGSGDMEEGEGEDNDEGWVDEVQLLSDEEQCELNTSLLPIQIVVAKVSAMRVQVIID